jgi:TP901 family phage tail tape measure protein
VDYRIGVIITTNAGQVAGGLDSFAGAANRAGAAAKGAGSAAGQSAAGFSGVAGAGTAAGQGMGNAAGAAGAAANNVAAAGESAGIAGRAIQGLGNFARQTAAHFAGYASVIAIMHLVRDAFGFVKDAVLGFDSAMTQSTAIMGNVSDQVKASLGQTALQVAMDYNAAVKDVASGYYYLVSAGYDVESSQKLIGQATAFSKAGMFDLEKATELAADAQTALGLKTKDAAENQKQFTRVTDVLTEANNKASGTVEQFAAALNNKAAASARMYGISLEETVAVLMAFSEQGTKAQKAGTAFDIVLRDIVRGARLHADAWKSLGITVFDAMGNFTGFANIMGQMQHALDGMSVKEKDATLATLGLQLRSVNFTKTLIGSSDRIREFQGDLENAGGATQKVAENQMESMIEKLAHLRSVAEVAAVEGFAKLAAGAQWLGSQLAPAVEHVVSIGSKMTDLFGPMAVGLGKLVGGGTVAALEAIAKTLEAVGVAADQFSNVVGGLLLLALGRLAVSLVASLIPAVVAFVVSLRTLGAAIYTDVGARLLYASDAAKVFVGQTYATGSAMQGAAASAGSLKTALVGLNGIALLAIATAAFTAFQAFGNADQAGQDLAKTVAGPWDKNNLSQMGQATDNLNKRFADLKGQLETYPIMADEVTSSMADILIPFHDVENSAMDLGGELKGVEGELEKLAKRKTEVTSALYEMAHALTDVDDKAAQAPKHIGILSNEAQKLAQTKAAAEVERIAQALARIAQVKGLDPTIAEDRKEIERLYQLGRETAPIGKIAEAFHVVGDAASDAEDTVKAFKDALDAVFGVAIGVHDAQTKLATGFADLAKQAGESKGAIGANAGAFDLASAAAKNNLAVVAANRDAVSEQIGAILKLATAYREQDMGSAQASEEMMKQYNVLLAQVQAYGLTEAQARSYLATLGMTPANIQTLAILETGTAEERATRLQLALDEIKKGATALAGVEKEEAARRAAELQTQLDVIKQGANAFVGAEKEEAQRRINEVQGQLDRAKQGATATVTANTGPAVAALNDLQARLDRIMAAERSATDPGNLSLLGSAERTVRSRAAGGVDVRSYAAGGEHHAAQIAPAGAWRVWAEPETGGEAYIPLARAKRDRSTDILGRVADLFGFVLVPAKSVRYADGGSYGLKDALFEMGAAAWGRHRIYDNFTFEGMSRDFARWLSRSTDGTSNRALIGGPRARGAAGMALADAQVSELGSRVAQRRQAVMIRESALAAARAVTATASVPMSHPRSGGGGIVIQAGAVSVTVRADASVDSGALDRAVRSGIEPALDGFARQLYGELRARAS